jgi:hypothetical protein
MRVHERAKAEDAKKKEDDRSQLPLSDAA